MEGNFYSLNEYLKSTFGEKVYKISLDLGLTCPNRDGTLDDRGCIFCHNGSSHFATCQGNIDERIDDAKKRIAQKTDAKKFIAYFQSFTNTYAPVGFLKPIFESVIKREDIVAISVATRPDCLPEDIIEMLSGLNKIKPVWVELGLQTANEKNAEYIRRCYKNEVYTSAVKALNEVGIDVITHIILGLPEETRADMLASVDLAVESGTKGIKLQLLHVLRDTDLYEDYKAGGFEALTIEEYMDILFDCIERLPKDIVIHRITGDAPKSHLAAPLWSADKKTVMNTIRREMVSRGVVQGKRMTDKMNRQREVKIMFVCHGNICRSPMAEFVFKRMLEERGQCERFVVASSATSTEEIGWNGVGNPVYPPARAELAKHGIKCDGKCAVQLQKSDYDKYDLFIGMDSENIRNMHRIFGNDKDNKIRKLMDYTARKGNNDVADPWYSDRFDIAYRDIYDGCEGLLKSLLKDLE